MLGRLAEEQSRYYRLQLHIGKVPLAAMCLWRVGDLAKARQRRRRRRVCISASTEAAATFHLSHVKKMERFHRHGVLKNARFSADFAVSTKEPQWQCLKSTPSLDLVIAHLTQHSDLLNPP
jgi:hypothetical protein